MDDLRWYKIFMAKVQMYTCDALGGSFISYVNEYQHWTFPKHSTRYFFTQCVDTRDWISTISNGKWFLKANNFYARYMPQHMSWVRVQNTREVRKLKYCVWARIMKRIDGKCLCYSLSVISDCAITGSSPHWICEVGELSHFAWCRIYALVNWIRGTGSAWFQVMAGCLSLPKVILTYCQLHTWE